MKNLAPFLCSGLFVLFFLAAVGQANPPLRISHPAFAPFHYRNQQGRMEGLFYDMLTEAVEKRMGIPIAWDTYPWPRCEDNLQAGTADAILTVPTAERARYSRTHSLPLFSKPLHLFTYVGHPQLEAMRRITALPAIRSHGFTVITYSNNGWHKDNVASLGIKTHESSSLKSTWLMLAARRGDLVIEWPASSWPDIEELNLREEIVDTGAVVSSMPFHLLVRPQSPHAETILSRMDRILVEMERDGARARIEQKYATGPRE